MLDRMTAALRSIGFIYVTLDTQGYRSGSMNDILPVSALASTTRPEASSQDSVNSSGQSSPSQASAQHLDGSSGSETIRVLEAAVDDLSPQVLAYFAETALAAGALDVMLTPVVMKKGRPGTLITVLCTPSASALFEQLILSETSTLGVRIRNDRRISLERSFVSVETPYGSIRIKRGSQGNVERNAAPEFEDCKVAAAKHGVPLKLVQQAAMAAYMGRGSDEAQ
jgi:hypothetical protein